MKNFSARKITQAAAIAAIYIVLTYITNLFGLANGVVQVRVSEALAVLPYFTATSIPGLFIGCLLSNSIDNLTHQQRTVSRMDGRLNDLGTLFLIQFLK